MSAVSLTDNGGIATVPPGQRGSFRANRNDSLLHNARAILLNLQRVHPVTHRQTQARAKAWMPRHTLA